MTPRAGWMGVLKSAFRAWREDDAPHLGAALAYYTVFSIVPLLMVVVGVAGLALGAEAVEGRVFGALARYIGTPAAKTLQDALVATRFKGDGGISAAVGIAALVFGASGVFAELKVSLNKIWKVRAKPGRGVLGFLRNNFSRVMLLAGTAFLMLVSMMASALVSALGESLSSRMPGGEGLWQVVNFVFALAAVTVLFAAVFKLVPDVRIAWRDAVQGGFVTALLFTLGQWLLGLYLGRSDPGSPFGAAGSLAVLLVWVDYTSQVFFLGAEYTRAYAALRGHGAEPDADAVAVPPGPESLPGAPAPRPT
jgi:membrane protein